MKDLKSLAFIIINSILIFKYIFLHYALSFYYYFKELFEVVNKCPPDKYPIKTIVIIGGTSGIGLELTKKLYSYGMNIIIASNQFYEGKQIVNSLSKDNFNNYIKFYYMNLSDQRSIVNFVKQIQKLSCCIDILINNAGIFNPYLISAHSNKSSIELHLKTNFLGPVLLTKLILPYLASKSRIINTTSCLHYLGSSQIFDQRYLLPGHAYYATSKAALSMWTFNMSKILTSEHGITINCCHPGLIYTPGLYGKFFLIIQIFVYFLSKNNLLRNTKDGAEGIVYLALSKDVDNISGKYFENCLPKPYPRICLDQNFQKRVISLYEGWALKL